MVVHLIPSVGPRSFGVGSVALDLTRELNSEGCATEIWCLDSNADCEWAATSSGLQLGKIRRFEGSWPGRLMWSMEMERNANRASASISIVHQHAIWTGLSRIPNMLRERHGIQTIITPHGMLQKWALNKSIWKKRIALALYERSNLTNASCLHAVGENELVDMRDYGLRNPVAVIPNGISAGWLNSDGDGSSFRRKYGVHPDRRILLFLSRITPKKGLLMLLEAVDANRKAFEDWCLVIAGADEFNHKAEVDEEIRRRGLADSVIMTGPLYGQLKRDSFAAASLFVLPSYSEGAPVVILEALGAGVPVLATKASPWQKLENHGCGWWTEIDATSIAEALHVALSRPADQLCVMGKRGKSLAAEYTWANSAAMTMKLYQWLLGRQDKPAFVHTF